MPHWPSIVFLIAALISTPGLAAETQTSPLLERGAAKYRSGDLEGALLDLDAAFRDSSRLGERRVAARAALHLAAVYLALDEEALASSKLRLALDLDPSIRPVGSEFPLRLNRLLVSAFAAQRVDVKLRRDAGRGLGKAPFALALLGAGASAGLLTRAVTKERENAAPSATILSVEPSGGVLAHVTEVVFAGTGTDSDNEPLRFEWRFGDGGSAQGQLATHVYQGPGSFRAELVVSDGLTSTTAEKNVEVVNLNDVWTPASPMFEGCRSLALDQRGRQLYGTSTFAAPYTNGGSDIGGFVRPSREVSFYFGAWDAVCHPRCMFHFAGTLSLNGNALDGTVRCQRNCECACDGQSMPVSFVRH